MTMTKSPVSTCGVKIAFLFPAQQIGSLHGNLAEHLVLGVNDPPLARHFGGFGGKRFHLRKRHEKYGWGKEMSTQAMTDLVDSSFSLESVPVAKTALGG